MLTQSIAKHRKGKKVMGSGQHGFRKRELFFTTLLVFCLEASSIVGEERAVAGVYVSYLVKPLMHPPLACC